MAGLRTSLQGRASLGALVSLGHTPQQGGGGDDGSFIITFDDPDGTEYILTFDDPDTNEYILTAEAA